MGKANLIVVALVLISLTFGVTILPERVRATTLYVGGAGPGNYTTIQAAVDDANPGDTVYVFNGTYYENIVVNKTLALVGENRDTTTVDGGGTGDVVHVSADWVNISGFTVTNSGPSLGDAGIELHSVKNCRVANNSVSRSPFGIYLSSSSSNTISGNDASEHAVGVLLINSSENILTGNFASDSGSGIFVWLSNNNIVSNNTVSNNSWIGIEIRESWDTTIASNNVSDNHYAIALFRSGNITLTDNMMVKGGILLESDSLEHWNTHTIGVSNTVNGKPVYYWKNAVGGTISSDTGQVILANCTGVVVENQTLSHVSVGIQLGFSSDNTVSDNSVLWNNVIGIYLVRSDSNLIINDTVTPEEGSGIELFNSDNNTIAKNIVSRSNIGFHLGYSNNTTIADNIAIDNGDGIRLFGSNRNTITNNTALSNQRGINLEDSSYNTIANNTIFSNKGWGMRLVFSHSNSIYHNNLIDNFEQALDDMAVDQWDDGYPSGGNYWSDYTGVDQYSGPNQDQPGSDSLGDTPYEIDANSEDRYPLMFPLGMIHPRPPKVQESTLSGKNLENITIDWSLSPDDGKGLKSVVGYEIYRKTTYDVEGSGYGIIASVPNGTSTFVDNYVGEGDPNNYFYRVCAVDMNSKTACANDQAGKFTRPLTSGPSLVSVPLIQSNESIETVLQTVKYDKAWFYDSSSQEWKWYMTYKEYRRGLWNVNHTMGIWVNVTQDSNLTVAGVVPAQTTIHLHEGWNLVSFPSFSTTYMVADLKAETGATRVEGYDPSPPNFLRVIGDVEVLQVGYGYWVRVEADTVWTITIE